MTPEDRQGWLEDLRQNPQRALELAYLFETKGWITAIQGAAEFLNIDLERSDSEILNNVDEMRKLSQIILENSSRAHELVSLLSEELGNNRNSNAKEV